MAPRWDANVRIGGSLVRSYPFARRAQATGLPRLRSARDCAPGGLFREAECPALDSAFRHTKLAPNNKRERERRDEIRHLLRATIASPLGSGRRAEAVS